MVVAVVCGPHLINGATVAGVVFGLDGLLPPSQAQRVQDAQMLLTHADTTPAKRDEEVVDRGGHGRKEQSEGEMMPHCVCGDIAMVMCV